MGYPNSAAGIFAGVVALIGLALISSALRTPGGALPKKTGWVALIGFLVIMAVIVAYFILRNE